MKISHEKGLSWYFSNANTRRYGNFLLRAMDWLGRKLSFLGTQDYDTLSQQTTEKPKFWNRFKIFIWKTGLGGLLGTPGAFFRLIAAKLSHRIDCKHYKKDDLIVSNFSNSESAVFSHDLLNKTAKTIKFLTLNVACLPYKPFGKDRQINGKFLRPNKVRVNEIADQILNEAPENQPDIISFQEAFQDASQKQLIEKLKKTYPFVVHHVGSKFLNAGSGLMVFSKFPIIETSFHPYTNTMIGEETIANKGFLGCKIQVSRGKFVTLYNTHTQSGGGLWKKFQAWLGGTTSARRGVEFGEIADHMKDWEALTPGPDRYTLTHLSTVLTGDLNTGLNNERSMLSISSGGSNNGFEAGQIKYPGQNRLFKRMKIKTPSNFIDIRSEENLVKGHGKPNNPQKVAQAEGQDLFTGSAPDDTALQAGTGMTQRTEIAKRSNRKLIDAMLMSKTSTPCLSLISTMKSYQNSTDHFGVEGKLDIPEAAC